MLVKNVWTSPRQKDGGQACVPLRTKEGEFPEVMPLAKRGGRCVRRKQLTTNFLYINLMPHPKAILKLGFLGRTLVTKNIDFRL